MRRLQKILPNAMPQRAVVHAAEAWRALHRWPEVVGERIAVKSWPDRFEKGTAYVAVTGSEWAQELRMQKAVILQKLRGLAGGRDLIRDIRFGVRKLPERPPEAPPPPPSRPEDTGESVKSIVERILSHGRDDP